jgi:hypothetical protein
MDAAWLSIDTESVAGASDDLAPLLVSCCEAAEAVMVYWQLEPHRWYRLTQCQKYHSCFSQSG